MDINKKNVFILLLFFSFLSFGLTFKAGFIWDDHQMIVDNPNIKSLTDLKLIIIDRFKL